MVVYRAIQTALIHYEDRSDEDIDTQDSAIPDSVDDDIAKCCMFREVQCQELESTALPAAGCCAVCELAAELEPDASTRRGQGYNQSPVRR